MLNVLICDSGDNKVLDGVVAGVTSVGCVFEGSAFVFSVFPWSEFVFVVGVGMYSIAGDTFRLLQQHSHPHSVPGSPQ